MKAGRKLDALIAERVMGWRLEDYGEGSIYFYAPRGTCGASCDHHLHLLPEFSTDIADAWSVVEKMKADKGFISITFYEDYPNKRTPSQGMDGPPYKAHWSVSGLGIGYQEGKIAADTAPHAICLAALKALSL